MTILITGASGFLGSHVARKLSNLGEHVVAALRDGSSLSRLHDLTGQLTIERCRTNHDLYDLVANIEPDTIFHTACAYGRNKENFLELYNANVDMGVTLLKSLSDHNNIPCKLINIGTVLNPSVSPYAFTKNIFSELGKRVSGENNNIQFINVKLQHMFGPCDDKSKFVTNIIRACQQNDDHIDLTEGTQRRDFIYIEDVVSALCIIRKRLTSESTEIEIGSGGAPTVREVVELISLITSSSSKLNFGAIPYRESEEMHCQADTTFLHSLGWVQRFSLEDGIRETIRLENSL